MFRPLPLFVGLRYTRSRQGSRFISFISGISIAGLVLGVMVLIVVLSVMNGFDRELRQRILGMVPHATITEAAGPMDSWQLYRDRAEAVPGVIAAAPFSEAQGLVTAYGHVKGAMMYGIEPESEEKVSILGQHMVAGALTDLKAGQFGIVVGELLARSLGVTVGDRLTVVLPDATVSPGGVFPRMKRFEVVGIFAVGADLDASLAYLHIDDAGRLHRYRPGEVQGLRLRLNDLFRARELAKKVAQELPGRHHISDWTLSHGRLFEAISMEKTMVGMLLALIVAVAAFNIVATLVMVVAGKRADIAILRTFGASPRTIMAIFMVQGAVIGVVGTLAGGLLGIVAALNIDEIIAFVERILSIHFLDPDVYFISYLPSELRMEDVVVVCMTSVTLSFLATLYPSFSASKIKPAEALRYE